MGAFLNIEREAVVQYTYNDWRDLLTSYDDQMIFVDTIGNPVSDGTWSYDWHHGRQLERLSK